MSGSTFASRSYRDLAVILRTHNLGEADRIITALTRHHGLIRAVAKGVRRTSSKFGASVEPFMVADLQCVHGRNLDILTQASTKASYGAEIVSDYDKYAAAHTMAETAQNLTDVDDDERTLKAHFELIYGALSAMARDVHPVDMIQNSYMLRALSLAGWSVTWDVCIRCGTQGAHPGFHAELGGPVCANCRVPGTQRVDPDTMTLLHALQRADWPRCADAQMGQRQEAGTVVLGYAHHYLERRLRSSAAH